MNECDVRLYYSIDVVHVPLDVDLNFVLTFDLRLALDHDQP